MCGNLARTPSSFNTWPVHLEFKHFDIWPVKLGQYTNCTLGPVIMVHFCQNLLLIGVAGAPEALQTKSSVKHVLGVILKNYFLGLADPLPSPLVQRTK